jgi:hypothetical protein
MSDETIATIGVEKVTEHEDGSATYTFHMDNDSRNSLANEGLKLILYCAATQTDIQDVYDWIEAKKEINGNELK